MRFPSAPATSGSTPATIWLRYKRLNQVTTSLDGRFPMKVTGKTGEVTIQQGETKLVELAQPTTEVQWRLGDYEPEYIDDVEPFDFVLIE